MPQHSSRFLKKVKTLLAADERRLTLIKDNRFIRVHRRLSAAQDCVSVLFHRPAKGSLGNRRANRSLTVAAQNLK
jgi:hypothetical protein